MSTWDNSKQQQKASRTYGKNVSPLDFLRASTSYSSPSQQQERYSLCENCEHFRSKTKQCKLCGCFMKLKVKLLEAECPAGKW